MQPLKQLNDWLERYTNRDRYLFSSQDLRGLFPDKSLVAVNTLLSRAVSSGYLIRVCRGIYMHAKRYPRNGLVLFHVAAHLRSSEFNYISLETALSDMGVVSQIPINYISLMSSGRSAIISCGKFGTIEFVHTEKKAADLVDQLVYDAQCRLWRAKVALALRDMKATRRTTIDLVDWSVADEFIR